MSQEPRWIYLTRNDLEFQPNKTYMISFKIEDKVCYKALMFKRGIDNGKEEFLYFDHPSGQVILESNNILVSRTV